MLLLKPGDTGELGRNGPVKHELNAMNTTSSPTPGAIAACAYQLWEKAGRPIGRDQEFWYEAERQLRADASASPSATSSAPASEAPKPRRKKGGATAA